MITQSYLKSYRIILTLFFSLGAFISVSKAQSLPKEFSNKQQAENFIKNESAKGNRASLTVQKQNKQRYTVLIKGFRQWGAALKQAQLLEKQGLSQLEVVKGRYERDYSIIVKQSLNKKIIGKTFNQLRRLGIKNVKVNTEKIKLVRYVVMVHKPKSVAPKPLKPTVKKTDIAKQVVDKKEKIKEVEMPEKHIAKSEKIIPKDIPEKQVTEEQDITLDDDSMVIVMSDASDITFEMDFEEEDEAVKESSIEWAIDKAILESEIFTRSKSSVDHAQYVNLEGHIKWQINQHWEMQFAARAEGYYQHGDSVAELNDETLDYGNNYLVFRDDSLRLTIGTDTVRWGKVDNFAPTDNMATLDFSRGVLYEWGEGYRSAPIIRSEIFFAKSKLDLVYLPSFRPAELPEDNSVWHPINKQRGALAGFGSNPMMVSLLQNGLIDDHVSSTDGGVGFRYSTQFDSLDVDWVIQRVKLSAPYYQINPALINPISVANPQQLNQHYALIEKHPRTWVVGGDLAFQAGNALFRFEAAWFSDLPATTTQLQYDTYRGVKWAVGSEFYPGDGDMRVNLQLSGNHIKEKQSILDRDNIISLSGEMESLFANNRWKLSGRFNIGLDEHDVYISPELAYLGWEPFEFYTAIHYLEGDENTLGGFYHYNTLVTIGWRGQF